MVKACFGVDTDARIDIASLQVPCLFDFEHTLEAEDECEFEFGLGRSHRRSRRL